ncbi:MAG TPA: EAL domain-containing protein [Gallionellaceae bacterium]|nr:EAL domain-containing protein [Gallionellaceae bacterium]
MSRRRWAILLPLALSIVVLVAAFTYGILRQEASYTEEYVGGTFQVAQRMYVSAVKSDTEKLSAALELITRDDGLRRAMLAHDRAALLQRSLPVFTRLRDEFGITHFYFHRPDLVNFLRVHQPERHSDLIDRYTATRARASGRSVSGLELGPLGTFTLRVVFPWYEGKQLIGYVELGEEIEHLLAQISAVTGNELCVAIDKQYLSRESWLAGMKMLRRQGEWERLDRAVITFQSNTQSEVPTARLLGDAYHPAASLSEISVGEHIYKAHAFPLLDVSGRRVGQMLLSRDVTAQLQGNQRAARWIVLLALLIGSSQIWFFVALSQRMERKLARSQSQLLGSEDKFRDLVESSSDWIWEVDADVRYVYSSPKIKSLLGYEAYEVLGRTPYELMPPDEAERVAREFSRILATREPFKELVNRNLHKDGREVILETSGVPVFNPDGSLRGYRGVGRDITERKRSEDALRYLTQRHVLRFQQTPLAVIEWDTSFRVTDWNPAAERIFGYSRDEAMGLTAAELILTPHDQRYVESIWQGLLSGESVHRSASQNHTRQGELIYCEWYNTPLVDENGKVVGVTSLAQDVTEQKMAEQQINHMAYYDDLTGLPNRLLFAERLAQIVNDAHRHERLVAVMLMDIDRFKFINDTLGHVAGNALLQQVAQRLQECLREGDIVARFGGDEFAVALADVSHADDVVSVAQKIVNQFTQPFDVLGNELFVTVSIGITLYPLDDDGIESLLRNADAAMYHAKERGRNNFQFYSAEMTLRSEKRMAIENGLRRALERDQLVLHYQPQVDLATGKMTGVETLLRWQHPERGLLLPGEFIQIAEETGLIAPIGEWVLRTACAQVKEWQSQGLPEICVAVNFSPRQFRQDNLPQVVSDVLEETGLEARFLELEITESLLIDGADSAVLFMLEEFKSLGVALAIDDFGTGYSSLSYLKLFPIDKLKIDQSFVRGIGKDSDDASLIRAIIAIARSLRLAVIAEGVETKEQLDYLSQQGCDQMQGYYFSHPLPAAELPGVLQSRLGLRLAEAHGERISQASV